MSRRARGFSLVGLLLTLVCIVVLFAIGMSAMNKAVTGEGSTVGGTVRSVQDQMALYAIHQSLVAGAADFGGRFLTPSVLADTGDPALDTTANLFSAMVMYDYARPEHLVAANEFSGYVELMEDYDRTAYRPADGTLWDPRFKADLDRLSHVSWAHVPLIGQRWDRNWRTAFTSDFPIMGSRGPKDGLPDPESWTYGRHGTWGGHHVYGDGHIEFTESFSPGRAVFQRDGQRVPDNVYLVEDGPLGRDAILAFTASMTREGPVLQFD